MPPRPRHEWRSRGPIDDFAPPPPPEAIFPWAPAPDVGADPDIVDDPPGPAPGALLVSGDDPHVVAYLAGRPLPTRGAPIRRSYATVISDEYQRASQIVVDDSGNRYTPSMWEKFLQNAPPLPVVELHARSDVVEFAGDLKGSWIAYLQKMANGDFAKTYVNGFVLPGNGVIYESCGQYMLMGCLGAPGSELDGRTSAQIESELKHHEAHSDVLRGRIQNCGRLSCPICLERAINRAAFAAARRMFSYLLLLKTNMFASHQPIAEKAKRVLQHVVVSIPPRDHLLLKDDPGAVKAKVLQDLRALGLRGGASVYHPWRFTRSLDHAYYSPHYHTLASGWMEPAHVKNLSVWGRAVDDQSMLRAVAKDMRRALDKRRAAGEPGADLSQFRRLLKIPRKDRYVYRSVSQVSSSLDIFSLLRYLLTHAGIADQKHAITYWGAAQNRYFRADGVLIHAADAPDAVHKKLASYVGGDMMVESAELELWLAPGGDAHAADRVDKAGPPGGAELLGSLNRMIEAAGAAAPHDHGPPPPTLDNPAKPQSEAAPEPILTSGDSFYCIVGRLRLRDGTGPAAPPAAPEPAPAHAGAAPPAAPPAAPEYHKEKCPPKEVVFCWQLDADTASLCQTCHMPLRSVVLEGVDEWVRAAGPGPPEAIQAMLTALAEGAPEHVQRIVDRGMARYVGPGDFSDGLPYFSISPEGGAAWSLDKGVARPGPHYDASAAPVRVMQDVDIEKSRWARIVKDVKQDALARHLPAYYHVDGSNRIRWDWDWLNEAVELAQDIWPPTRLPRAAAKNMRPLVGGGVGAHA